MTCIALGIIINVTKKEEEIAEEIKDNARRESAFKKRIDMELEEENSPLTPEGEIEKANDNYSIVDRSDNPINAVFGK
jgi:cell division protein FtsW